MSATPSVTQHLQRIALHNEVHARPPEAMTAPLVISHMVMLCNAQERQASRVHVAALLRDRHLPLPDEHTTHLRLDVGPFRLRWEMHTEFVTWSFLRTLDEGVDAGGGGQEPLTAVHVVPQNWLAALPGQCLASVHLWALPLPAGGPADAMSDAPAALRMRQLLQDDTLVASSVADGHGQVLTDFAIAPDGFSRIVLLTAGLSPRRLGRLVQQLLEIDTYRMAALLGLPAARDAAQVLAYAERELAELADAIRNASRNEEPQLLDRLTKLAGQVESQYATTHARFSASAAYFELVDKRIGDIAESRLRGLQTIGEFMDRRLTPARSTCVWATRRQDALSQRVSRMSNLLRTRVEIEQQQSSQALLGAMNHRQGLQLKLQSTVEGLSVAAITYYIVGLLSYAAKGAQSIGWPYSPESTAAAAIPLVLAGVWWTLRRLHHRVRNA